jgi:hypothetical protein
MGADVTEAEEASDEVMAAIAAGGTYSFVPEPDEDEAVLPGEDDMLAELAVAGPEDALQGPGAEVIEEEAEAVPAPARARVRKAVTKTADEDQETVDESAPAAAHRSRARSATDVQDDDAAASDAS